MLYQQPDQPQQARCLLFVTGWGMDPRPFLPLQPMGYDLYLLSNHQPQTLHQQAQASLALCEQLQQQYRQRHLIAWSLGVWLAAHLFAKTYTCFHSRWAINGTLTPINSQTGIPQSVYTQMENNFSAQTRLDFENKMFDLSQEQAQFQKNRPERHLLSLADELTAFRLAAQTFGPAPDIFQHKIIGQRDRIFPARGQCRGWRKEGVERFPLPHFPFYQWQSLLPPSHQPSF